CCPVIPTLARLSRARDQNRLPGRHLDDTMRFAPPSVRRTSPLAVLALLAGLLTAPVTQVAHAAEVADLTASVEAPGSILAGESGSLTLGVHNTGGDRFNLEIGR